jgi:hypothetical protein
MAKTHRPLVLGSFLLLAAAGVGCDGDREPPASSRPEAAAPPAPADQSTTVISGGGSHLKKAKDSAHGLEQQVQQHNDEIEKKAKELSGG